MHLIDSSTASPSNSSLGSGVLIVSVGTTAPFEPTPPALPAAPWIPPWAWDAAYRFGPTAARVAVEAAVRSIW